MIGNFCESGCVSGARWARTGSAGASWRCGCVWVVALTSYSIASSAETMKRKFQFLAPPPAGPCSCFVDEPAALFEQIAAAMDALDLVANPVRQRHFGNFVRVARALGL